MLGIRLSEETEQELDRHARALGRPKSVIAREWIVERLERELVDAEMRRVAQFLAAADREKRDSWDYAALSDDFLRALDEEDGGYEWGPDGPPTGRAT